MRHLFAWEDDVLVGCFNEHNGVVDFTYEHGTVCPISLSLPLDGSWSDKAPAAFLDGLLPEGQAERLQMKSSIGAASTDAFDLLDGVDSTGGLVFTQAETPPKLVAEATIATDDDIRAQMQHIYAANSAWWHKDVRNRFSLAGNQGKFPLARINGRWFWPNATLPSTHIVKPDAQRVPDISIIEHATMELARHCNIPTAETQAVRFADRTGLLVTRFDRLFDADGRTIHRLRTEDMTQALGAWSRDKYDFEISELVRCLCEAGADEVVSYELIRQISFNALVGNHDAHAKNYSVFLTPDGVRLAPLYDAICMAHWNEFKYDVLAMPVNGVYDPREVTLKDWRAEAESCNLDPDRVEEIVVGIERDLLSYDYATLPCGPAMGNEIGDYVRERGRDIRSSIEGVSG